MVRKVKGEKGKGAKPKKAVPVDAPTKDALTTKQRLFVESYLSNGFNATEAARTAGYQGNENTLSSVGYENLRKPEIAQIVGERVDEAAMSANEVLSRLSEHARASVGKVLKDDGSFSIDYARENSVDQLIKKITTKKTIFTKSRNDGDETEETETVTLELHDSQAALVHLGKYHKLFTEKHEHTGKDGEPLMKPVAEALTKIYGNAGN
jgi:phage terminase small subunit